MQLTRDSLSFQAFRMLGVLARLMGRRQAERTACLFGDFFYDVVKVRRGLVLGNLARTFPEKSPAEIGRIARSVYRNLAVSLFEALRLPLVRTREDAAALVDIDDTDAERFFRKTRGQNRGAVLVSAHYGNWELMAMTFGLLLTPITIVVKPQKNRLIDRQINSWRTMRGNRVVARSTALRDGLKLLGEGGVLALLGDQSDPNAGYFADFLGRKTSLFLGAAFFALKAGVPLFVTICRRNDTGRSIIEIREIDTSDLAFRKQDIRELALRYTKVLEDAILRYPEEWFWLHNRWKRSVPEGQG
jgi:KDO2-lipid IV(A) lauroyltransferase